MDIGELFSLLEKEEKVSKPEKLQKNYFKKISDDLKRLRNQIKKIGEESDEAKKLADQFEKIKDLVKDIMDKRLEKILKISFLEVREKIKVIAEDDLTEEERAIYIIIKNILENYLENIEEKILNGENPEIEKIYENIDQILKKKNKKANLEILIIRKDLPQKIVGPNSKVYGPFYSDEIVLINKDLADRLIQIGIAEKIIENKEE